MICNMVGRFSAAMLCIALLAIQAQAQQTVLLDFDSGTDGSINYTQIMRDDVQSMMETIYQDFGVSFTQSNPTSGAFTTLTFNSGAPGGVADAIDFRNLDANDNAVVNVEGLGFTATDDIVGLSANIAAHEFGHLMGLRHYDSFGPIGSGVFSGLEGGFLPAFSGPTDATEFNDHVMSTPAFGASVARFTDPVWLSERSAIKLAAIDQATILQESAAPNNVMTDAEALQLFGMEVPNTIVAGQNAAPGTFFDVDAVVVEGSLTAGDVDFYSFEGEAGDLFNFEVISGALDRLTDTIDSQISIFDSAGQFVDYFGQDSFNDDEIETFDSFIVDLTLPDTGTYFIQINAFAGADTGDYELFFHRFNGISAVPEPSSLILIGCVGTGLLMRRRRS